MTDENSPKPLPAELPPGATSLAIIRNPDGLTTREQPKNAKGQFVKKAKPLIPSIEFTRAERKRLNSVRSDKEGLTEYMLAFNNLLRIAQHQTTDAKEMMAVVKAFEVLRQSALGKFAPSEQELDKLQTQPVRVVVIQAPQLMHPEIQKEEAKEITKPSFAEVLSFDTNKS